MEQERDKILSNMKDAGCKGEALEKAEQLYEAGDTKALLLHLRKCRCVLMEELHECQRKVDRMDYLIRQTKAKPVQ